MLVLVIVIENFSWKRKSFDYEYDYEHEHEHDYLLNDYNNRNCSGGVIDVRSFACSGWDSAAG